MLTAAFLLIFVAEFGDKTQLAVAGLSSAEDPLVIWVGSTVALVATTVIGVLAGQALMRYVSLQWIHRASGVVFFAFGLAVTGELVSLVV